MSRTNTAKRVLSVGNHSIAWFLLIQVLAGLLLSLGTLSSVCGAKWFQVFETIHTGWDPVGSVYRIILGLGTFAQVALGITIRNYALDKESEEVASALSLK
jgi:hypothetical protein